MKKHWSAAVLLVLLVLVCAAAGAQDEAEWTILWYVCGTDLETGDGAATYNLQQAIDGKTTDDAHVLIVTGGTEEWQNHVVPNDAIALFGLTANGENGGLEPLLELEDQNMADPELLAGMIARVFAAYPAKHTMLILWDHGGGSVGGVAFDERTGDALSLAELDRALAAGGQHLDIIGFDACLMSTLEVANTLAPYADYLVASQELEPGGGWNYTALMRAVSQSPGIEPAALGKIICDSFLQQCIAWDDKEIATLAVTNLTKIPALTKAFDAMAWQLSAVAGNPAAIQAYRQDVSKARNFGGNNRSEGYTHMVDLGELVLNTEGVWDEVGLVVLDALFDAVEYRIDGSDHPRTNGLSVFYPFTTDAEVSAACAVIAEQPVSRAYMRFVGAMVPAWHMPDAMLQAAGDRPDTSYAQGAPPAQTDAEPEAAAEELDAADYQVSVSTAIDEDGFYTLYVDSGLDFVEDVQFALYLIDNDENAAILLGTDNDIDAYWDEGVFYDNFRGVWLTINGEYCSPILIETQDSYNLYTIPVERNGKRTNLRARYVIDAEDDSGVTGHYEVLGVWDGTDESTGIAARDIKPLQEGDSILPLFDAYPLPNIGGEAEEWTSGEITAGPGGAITLEELDLFDGEYYYTFMLTDIFGQYYESVGVSLYMEGDEFYFDLGE